MKRCAFCQMEIKENAVVDVQDRLVYFHLACYVVWQRLARFLEGK
jgi:hypothetical protein